MSFTGMRPAFFFSIALWLLFSYKPSETSITWTSLEEGLTYGTYKADLKSIYNDQVVNILKIDPALFQLKMITSKETGEKNKTAKGWAQSKKLIAAFNAGMYLSDHKTNRGYMVNHGYTNNSRLNADNTILAFDPKEDSLPKAQIIDRTCQDWETMKESYHCMTQSIRMVDCNQKNRWSKQAKMWSMLVVATDKEGNILFIFCRSPYTVHNFINLQLKAPLNIYNMMYLEGGPEASFYLNHPKKTVERFGSYETDFITNDNNDEFWEIPNVVGIVKRD